MSCAEAPAQTAEYVMNLVLPPVVFLRGSVKSEVFANSLHES